MNAAVLMLAAMGAAPTMPNPTMANPTMLDGFERLTPWTAAASDGVASHIASAPGATGKAMALDYDFGAVAGYAYAQRALPIDWPENFEISLKVRGSGGVNDLQVKFVDASGRNVWWWRRANFRPSADWQTITIRARDVEFAWGPTDDKALTTTAAMELVVVRGRDGGAGRIDVDDLTLTPRPPLTAPGKPIASDPRAMDRRADTAWQGRGGQALQIDLGGHRTLGGLSIDWTLGKGAPAYAIEASDDARTWRTLYRATDGDGGNDPIPLPDAEAAYLRIGLPRGAPRASLAEVTVEPASWAKDLNGFVASLARTAPRGTFPRGFSEQPYWTLVGTDGGGQSGLIGEDGEIEVAKGAFSIAPFVVADGVTFGWADVAATQSLRDGDLPMPEVTWRAPDWHLETTLVADQTAPRLLARWRLVNDAAQTKRLRLVLTVRPFQVNPPAQFLSQQGGVAKISAIAWRGGQLAVTSAAAIAGDAPVTRTLAPLVTPTAVATRGFDQGALMNPATATAKAGGATHVRDPHDLASAALAYDVELRPGEAIDVPMVVPFGAAMATPDRAAYDRAVDATAAYWRKALDRVSLNVPPAKQAVADTVKTALAHILMSRDGPQLKPGTRSYDRSWIRDGAMMADTLLRVGLNEPALRFADWYGGKLFANGKVPCCVDSRGPDPVPENDAQGEFIHLLVQLYRFTGNRDLLTHDWPKIAAALRYMETQRQSERTPENRLGDRAVRYGLMPPSISHEGYSSAPQYSLWDDFWALTGYKDAAYAARVLGKADAATIATHRDEFAADIHAAIAASTKRFGIDFIPGATSLGDFDATSTTIALDPAGELTALDRTLLTNTFDRQWRRVMARDGDTSWADYTPYELRNVSAFVRLGWRTRANALLDFYMRDRRPAAWNGWAEVVGRNPREIRFIGDMPHAWVASDFVRAALDLFAYERGGDDAIVLGGGLDSGWLADGGAAIRGLRTSHGTVDFAIRAEGDGVVATIGGTARPPAGFVLGWPLGGKPGTATIDG
ncbi:MAG: discoidin domain-containing protein, partial [Sphingomonas bacterium]|nr:discoidin domain-containing protein [Sphingomonas bacterium]